MIIKRREKPDELIRCERLLRRLPPTHIAYSEVDKQRARLQAGFYGEKSLDYYVSQLPQSNLHIFQDLRLLYAPEKHVQIDHLILTRHSIVVNEVKHIKGRIFIDRFQMTRELTGVIDSYQNPVHQIENHLFNLNNIIYHHHFPKLPILPLITFTNSNSIIEISKDYPVQSYIIRPEELRREITTFHQSKPNILSELQFGNLSNVFLELHTPKKVDVLEKYGVDKGSLFKGIYCAECGFTKVKQHVWRCSRCNLENDRLMIDAILDYYFLIGPNITVRACMNFLGISSRYMIYRLFKRMDFIRGSDKKRGEYYIDIEKLKEKYQIL